MPPQLPWPGQALRANRARTSASWSATWKADTRSMRSPVAGSIPGRMGPSERMTAGVSFSSTAATVPTGGLSHATTATSAGDAVRRQVDVGHVVDELAPDQGEAHLRRAVELAVRDAQGERGRDQADRQVVLGDAAVAAPPGRPAPSAGRRDSTGCRRGCRSPPRPGRGSCATSSPRKAAVPTRCTSRPGLRDTSVAVDSVVRRARIQTNGAGRAVSALRHGPTGDSASDGCGHRRRSERRRRDLDADLRDGPVHPGGHPPVDRARGSP